MYIIQLITIISLIMTIFYHLIYKGLKVYVGAIFHRISPSSCSCLHSSITLFWALIDEVINACVWLKCWGKVGGHH